MPVVHGFGARQPVAPTELPQYGTSGTGFVRNEQTGATRIVGTPDTGKATVPAAGAGAAAPSSGMDQVRALANEIMASQPGVSFSAAMQNAARTLGGATTAGLHSAQTAAATQQSAITAQQAALEQEEAAPTTTPERRAQIRAQRLSKSGDVWTPYQAKDDLGMPTGEPLLYNRATGETKPIEGVNRPASGGPMEGSKSTSGGKPIVFKSGKWEFA